MCREMKDSGVKWIGCIPKTWNITKIKMLSDIYTGTSISDDLKDKYTVKENATPYISTKDLDVSYKSIDYDNGLFIPNGEKGFRLAEKDSTLICIEGGSAGKKVAFTDREVNFVNKLCCIKSRNYNNKFIYYYINSSAFTEQFNLNLSGLIGGVSINLLKQIITVVPTVAEQQKISNYLDKKVSQINDIISKQKTLIEKYKVYKQSLITETVTKGLNKNVPMKDSGIEWIGEIPTHWSIKKMKYLGELNASGVDKKIRENEKLYKSVHYVNVYKNGQKEIVNSDNYLVISCDDNKAANCTLIQGDVLFTNSSETAEDMGTSTVVAEDLVNTLFGYHLMRFRPYSKVLWYKYEKYLFSSNYMRKWFEYNSVGITRFGLSQRGFSESQIIYAPYEEQIKIADFLDKKCNVIDYAISKKEQLIEKLEEYKKSLIYECVTGKREVN